MHADADAHDTSNSPLICAPGALGVDSNLHTFPFQRSASVTKTPERITRVPTAAHREPAEHETPKSWPARPTGLAIGAIDQPPSDAVAAFASVLASTTKAPKAAILLGEIQPRTQASTTRARFNGRSP